MIEVRNLIKRFGGTVAVDDLPSCPSVSPAGHDAPSRSRSGGIMAGCRYYVPAMAVTGRLDARPVGSGPAWASPKPKTCPSEPAM